jgi:hypothetical protein
MEALPDEDSPPEAFARYPLALVSPFFKSFARELGGSPAEKAIKVKNLVKGRYARTRMKQLFGLTTTQIDSVLMEVKASTCWRPIIEELGGGKFVVPDCPSSAKLVPFSTDSPVDVGRGEVSQVKVNTLGDQLGKAQVARVWVPFSLFKISRLFGLASAELGTTAASELATEWALWVYSKTGQFNLGIHFIWQCARQFEHVYPKGTSPNKKRPTRLKWEQILEDKTNCMNRKDATVRRCTPLHPSRACCTCVGPVHAAPV